MLKFNLTVLNPEDISVMEHGIKYPPDVEIKCETTFVSQDERRTGAITKDIPQIVFEKS